MPDGPSIDELRGLRERLGPQILRTPVMRCAKLEEHLGGDSRVIGKLEFLQHTGTFKARGALAVISSLNVEQRAAARDRPRFENHSCS